MELSPLSENFLQKYPQRESFKIQGCTVNVPAVYRGEAITGVFPISYEKALEVIDSTKFKPAKLTLTKALISVTIFDFKESPIGPYKEVSYAIPVLYKPLLNIPLLPALLNRYWKNFGYYVLDLLQSTEIAIAHGKILSGYPHNSQLIDLTFSHDGNNLSAQVKVGSKQILSIEAIFSQKQKIVLNKYQTYFKKQADIFRIQMDVLGINQSVQKCELNFAEHNLTSILKTLKVSSSPIEVVYYPDFIEVLPVTKNQL